MTRRALLALALLLGLAARPAGAQGDGELMRRAIDAYRQLDLDTAAELLRRVVRALGDSAPVAQRARALAYLGSTELFRERRDSAVAAFRRLLQVDPRFELDRVVFPPRVEQLFREVQRETRTTAIRAPAEAEVQPGQDSATFAFWLYVSAPQGVTATLARADGRVVRSLYDGAIDDSLEVRWNGLDTAGEPPPSGRYVVTVTSTDARGQTLSLVQLPLRIRREEPDTQAWPARPPPVRPGPTGAVPIRAAPVRALAAGLVAGGAALVLPKLVGGTDGSGTRFVVAGAVSLTGAVSFFTQTRRRDPRVRLEAEWRRRAEAVAAQNATRRRNARLVIQAGAPVVLTPIGS